MLSCHSKENKVSKEEEPNQIENYTIKKGVYQVMGYALSQRAKDNATPVHEMLPTFSFLDAQKVKISCEKSDVFKESVYQYNLKNDTLYLTGTKQNLQFYFVASSENVFDLHIESDYIDKLTLTLVTPQK